MKRSILGHEGHHTGDIKLASALMSIGVPLRQESPVRLVLKEDGSQYASFYLLPSTVDGKESTASLMSYWSDPSKAPTGHALKEIMAFIKDAPADTRHAESWLEHGHSWLRLLKLCPPDAPRNLEAIPDFVDRHRDDIAGYVFSFAYNRDTCWKEYLKAKESPDYLLTRGKAFTKINHSSPKRITTELLSRLKG